MKTLYLDIFSGISGDMFLGALVDVGVDFHALERELQKLALPGYHLHTTRQERGHIAGTKFDVHLEGHSHCGDHDSSHAIAPAEAQGHSPSHHHHHHHDHEHDQGHDHRHEHVEGHATKPEQGHAQGHDAGECGHGCGAHSHSHESGEPGHEHEHGRTFADIRGLISRSGLSAWVKEKSLAVFRRVAEAEGRIHGKPLEQVHFHEVGAVDSIVDIVGACVGLELLGRPRVLAGAVVEGVGFVTCAHGRFPLPAPATLEILKARTVVVQQTDEPAELVTPTGAALLAEFAESFGPMLPMRVERIGYGLGGRENKTRPNVLRAVLGEAHESSPHDWERDEVVVLETNLDDISAELLGAFLEKAMASGALDVFHTPIQMKKSRPGVLLSVLCAVADADRFTALLLRDTTAFGVRRSLMERRKLRREIRTARTSFGEVEVKLGWLDGRMVQVAPEFESCRRTAEANGAALWEVFEAARRAFL